MEVMGLIKLTLHFTEIARPFDYPPKFMNMLSMQVESGTQAFLLKNYCGFNTKSYCSDVCGYNRRPETLAEICKNTGICCGFRAVAAMGKYPGFMLFGEFFGAKIFTLDNRKFYAFDWHGIVGKKFTKKSTNTEAEWSPNWFFLSSPGPRWQQFCTRQFLIIFCNEKFCVLIQISPTFVALPALDNNFAEPMMTHWRISMRHQGPFSVSCSE